LDDVSCDEYIAAIFEGAHKHWSDPQTQRQHPARKQVVAAAPPQGSSEVRVPGAYRIRRWSRSAAKFHVEWEKRNIMVVSESKHGFDHLQAIFSDLIEALSGASRNTTFMRFRFFTD
jgi:hypothetical protein